MTTNIRLFTKKDKPVVMRILRSMPEFTPAEVAVAEEVIDSYLADTTRSGYHILVAEVDSTVAGYICYGLAPLTEGTWDIYWIVVTPEKQGQGIGSALIAFAEGKIRGAGGRLVFVETSSQPQYEGTRRFYQHQGYELICQVSDFYAPGDDKLVLQKRLR
jgi:GNAT superfamily N-acetyltransferase